MGRFLKILFLRYNVFIAICAIFLTAWFELVFQINYPIEVYLFNFLASYVGYNWLRSIPSFKALLQADKRIYLISFIVAFPILIVLYAGFTLQLQLVYGICVILTFLYRVRLFLNKNFRSIVFLKFPTIALVWTIMGCAYGVTQFGCQIPLSQFIFVIIMQFLVCLSLTIPYDVFSLHEDFDIVTLPKRVGVEKALLFSNIFIILYFVVAFFTDESIQFMSAANIVSILAIIIIYFSGNFKSNVLKVVLIDGIIILQFAIFYWMLK